jgi:hypothetical protein
MNLIEERRNSSTILDLGNRWKRVLSFTPIAPLHRGENRRYPMNSLVRHAEPVWKPREENILALVENRTPAIHPVDKTEEKKGKNKTERKGGRKEDVGYLRIRHDIFRWTASVV